jgi:PASTA domain
MTSSRTVRTTIAVASVAAIGALGAASAQAVTTTIGSALTLPYQGGVSTSAGTVSIQQTQVGGMLPHPLTSPGNGIVTEWKVRTSDDDAHYMLRIFTASGTNTYTGTGGMLAPTPVPAGTTDAILTYPGNSLPIKEGQHIGLLQLGTPDEGIAQNTTSGVTANVFANLFTGNPADGVATAFLPDAQHELLLQATVRYCKVPNVVGQKTAAAQQALTAAECASKVSRKKTKKKKNRGKVLGQKTAADSTVPPGTEVEIVVGTKAKKKKKKK